MYQSGVEISSAGLQTNAKSILAALPEPVDAVFVVKSDAYGHGLPIVVRNVRQAGGRRFAVASLAEARMVRETAPDVQVIILGVSDPQDVSLLHEIQAVPIVANEEHALMLAQAARACGLALNVHLKIDTGMGRLGFPWQSAERMLETLRALPELNVCGLCSHFATVEPDDFLKARQQAERFSGICRRAEQVFGRKLFKHISSSRAAGLCREWDFDAVRPGIALYGYGTGGDGMRFRTKPVLEWKTRVTQVRAVPAGTEIGYYGSYVTEHESVIATLAAGYADGYNRALSNCGDVLVNGCRCRVVGRVSMNWIMADITRAGEVKVGAEAVLIGRQGPEEIFADELARICRTIPYEILTSISPLIPRTEV